MERSLGPARRLGEPAVERLWAQGLAAGGDAAVELALDGGAPRAIPGRDTPGRSPAKDPAKYPGPRARAGTLTPRERQVAALIAGGRSNKGIAEELSISPATAARHVANILAKLSFSSRVQIATWAVDHLDAASSFPASTAAQN